MLMVYWHSWRVLLWGSLVACLALVFIPVTQAAPGGPAPLYWQKSLFFIPYQAGANPTGRVKTVQLLVSRDGHSDWRLLQEAQPNVKGFSYHAPEDGEYWFAVRHLDAFGRNRNTQQATPQLRIIVDTTQPQLRVDTAFGGGRELVLRYEASDANLSAESLILEVRADDGPWSSLTIGLPDVRQPDKVVGRASWKIPAGVQRIEVRAAIMDRAGHRAHTHGAVAPRGLALPAATTNAPSEPWPAAPRTSATKAAPRDWPVDTPQSSGGPAPRGSAAPPLVNPYSAPAQLVASQPSPGQPTGKAGFAPARSTSEAAAEKFSFESLGVTPLDANNAPLAEDQGLAAGPTAERSGWAVPSTASVAGVRVVNSRTFEMEYDIDAAGPWGIAQVELWGTHDGGRTWQSYGTDADTRSPLRVTVPGAGTYGFRILVQGAGGARTAPPQAGEPAELLVAVDLSPPNVELTQARLGQGDLADQLTIAWTASDTNLQPRPITLLYSSRPHGPWSTIAAGLENTGSYTWRIERHVPVTFYLRVEAHDTAGNLGAHDYPESITLPRPQPTGRLRSVRPVDY